MRNGDDQSSPGSARRHEPAIPGDALDRIIIRLTVVQGSVQLARRRLRRDSIANNQDMDKVLARAEQATRDIADELWGMMKAAHRLRQENPDTT